MAPRLPEIDLPNGWDPRAYQMPLWLQMEAGRRFFDVVAHRRWGKDDVALHFAATQMVQRVGTYWHLLPEASQARKAIWDAVNPHTGKRRIDEAFPEAMRATTRENEMFLRLRNGSTWQVVGSDNFNSLVGSPPVGLVFSEWSLARPEAWTYLSPILEENGGWALFIWTPRGRNHATRAFEARERDPERWYTLRSPATTTDVFTAEQLAKARQERIDEVGSEEEGNAQFAQEYLVDFDAAVPGSYYGAQMGKAQTDGRIGDVAYDPTRPVHTAWDLGKRDYTAVWFLQEDGREARAIDYYEASGQEPEDIVAACMPELLPDEAKRAAALANLGRAVPYTYGTHYLPHDVKQNHWGAGRKSRLETLGSLGLKHINVGVPADEGRADHINAVRLLLAVMSFDARRCATGIDRLRNYRKAWSKSLGVYIGPLHDENSHGADALGEFAVNKRIAAPFVKPPPPARKAYAKPKRRASGWSGV